MVVLPSKETERLMDTLRHNSYISSLVVVLMLNAMVAVSLSPLSRPKRGW
jgi:hypothetical protein